MRTLEEVDHAIELARYDMKKLMKVMHMEEIPPDEIILTPKLFK